MWIHSSKRYFFASALLAAQRFFVAAMIAARPAALSFRFAFFAGPTTASPLATAHLFRWASEIAFRPAALIPLFFVFGAELSVVGA
jgi:hypothetical protein